MSRTEAQTRRELIDNQLAKAGWSPDDRSLLEEFRMGIAEPEGNYQGTPVFAGYVLLDRAGKPLAVVEAKRANRDPIAGKRQAADYADRIRRSNSSYPGSTCRTGTDCQDQLA